MTSPEKIYTTAFSKLGRDASPADLASDELGCAETVSDVLFDAGCTIPIMLSTAELRHWLSIRAEWQRVEIPHEGDVIISPTGEGGRNGITHGHTGIIMDSEKIASNNSRTGLFEENYTLAMWEARYQKLGGYPVYFFRYIGEEASPEIANMVSDGLSVAGQALAHPELKAPALGLLSSLLAFLKSLTK